MTTANTRNLEKASTCLGKLDGVLSVALDAEITMKIAEAIGSERASLLQELYDAGMINNKCGAFHEYFNFGYMCSNEWCRCKE